jgi:hypothetical protein
MKKILILSLLSACAGLQCAGLGQDIQFQELNGVRFKLIENVMALTSEPEDQAVLDQLRVVDVYNLIAKAKKLNANKVSVHDYEYTPFIETFKGAGFKVKARNEGYVVLEKAVN